MKPQFTSRQGIFEFLGTFFLTFGIIFTGQAVLGTGMSSTANHIVTSLGMGVALLFVIFMFRKTPADLNPAVTAYKVCTGEKCLKNGLLTFVIQMGAGMTAGILAVWTGTVFAANGEILLANGGGVVGAGHLTVTTFQMFVIEFMTTAVLVWIAFRAKIADNIKAVLIAAIVAFGIYLAWNISGGGLNPARAIGSQIGYGLINSDYSILGATWWAFILAPISAGVIVALITYLSGEDEA